MKLRGCVIKRPIAAGSKSERGAVVLATDAGDYVLRRQGGNPFTDPLLDSLVGKSIEGEGVLHGYTFIMSDWTEVAP